MHELMTGGRSGAGHGDAHKHVARDDQSFRNCLILFRWENNIGYWLISHVLKHSRSAYFSKLFWREDAGWLGDCLESTFKLATMWLPTSFLVVLVSNFLQFFSTPIVVECTKIRSLGRKEVTALNGQHLKIAAMDIRPYMLIEHDLKGEISKADGIVYQMVLWLSKRFNFTFTLVEPPDRTFGAVINNTWNGMIGMTINRDVDFVAGPVIPSEARAQVIDFSVSYLDEPAACLIPAPTLDENKWTAVFKPFHYDVWLIAIVSLVSVAVASWMTMNLYWKWCYDRSDSRGSLRYVLSFDQHVLSALALFFSQGQNTATRAPHSNRIAISSWCLMSTVLVYAYSSCIISYITIPKSHLLVNSIEELANSKILQVATHKNSFFETTLLQSSSGSLKLLGDSLRKNPENSFSGQYYNQTMLLKRVFGRLALLTGRLQLEMLMELNYRQTRRCELTLLPQQFMPILKICLALPKGSPYIHLINLGIIEMKQVGLIDRWIKVYINQTNQCKHGIDFFQHHSNSEIKHPLALSNLAGAFILLLLGVIVATSMFLCEVCFSKNRNQH